MHGTLLIGADPVGGRWGRLHPEALMYKYTDRSLALDHNRGRLGGQLCEARLITARRPAYARLDQRQRPTVDYADEAIRADLARGEGLLDMR